MSPVSNIAYATQNLSQYFGSHRTRWEDFYPSERKVIERLAFTADTSVLDMGCACGGLGIALRERFDITDYTGVDINPQCIERAPSCLRSGTFLCGDFLEVQSKLQKKFDATFSLGCADWNVETERLVQALFAHTAVNGSLIMSCRVTNRRSVQGLIEGQQNLSYLDYGGAETNETAPYKIYQLSTLLAIFSGLPGVSNIYAYGYWGTVPPSVEGIPFSDVFFIVCSIKRGVEAVTPRLELDVAADLLIPAN